MQLRVLFGLTTGVFALPCDVVDNYLTEATPEALRVLLYLYRHGGEAESGALCRVLEIDEPALLRALDYWAARGLLTRADGASPLRESAAQAAPADTPAPVRQAAPARAAKAGEKAPNRAAPHARTGLETPAQYTATDVANRAKENEELRFLLETAPTLLGRLLSPADCSTLLFLYDSAGLPVDVILMLLEYCVTTGHTNLRYVEKVALSWAGDGIDTHEKAEARIRHLEALHSYEGQVRSMLGITGRALTPGERTHLARWQSEWQTPLELVRAAFDICVKRTGKLSFSYMNTILKDWHEKGYKTPEQARNERRGRRAPGGAGKAATYDLGEYVDLSMKRLLEDK